MNYIYFIGNGFDLTNNLKTSYKDFIKWYLKRVLRSLKKYGYYSDKLIEVNQSFIPSDFLYQIDHFIRNLDTYTNTKINSDFNINCKSDFVKQILLKFQDENWSGIEDAIFLELKKQYLNLIPEESVRRKFNQAEGTYRTITDTEILALNYAVDELKKNLLKYLSYQNNPKNVKIELLTKFKEIEEIWRENDDKLYIINFNYTNYINKYIKEIDHPLIQNNRFEVINIHGDLEDDINNIIFGIGDEHYNFYQDIESQFGNEWLYLMKSFSYLKNYKYQKLITEVLYKPFHLLILGHSCGITDRTLLKMIFEHENCIAIYLMHRGEESYIKTAYNISRNFDNKILFRKKLMPYEPTFYIKL